jgi:hypothetical protein
VRATVHSSWRRRALCAAAIFTLAGCAKNPTFVLTTVNADQTVPALTQLTLLISSAADPSIHVSSMLVSHYPGSLDGGLPVIALPAQFPFSVDPNYLSGAAIIRVDGVDNDTGAVLATGSTPAQIIPQEQTEASLTLTAVGACAGDAGAGDGNVGGDGGSTCSGGPDGGATDAADSGG